MILFLHGLIIIFLVHDPDVVLVQEV